MPAKKRAEAHRDEDELRRYVEHMAMLFADWGFPRMAARVLMMMMAADETRLTAAEIAERLAISPAAVSGAVRYLQQIGVLLREPEPGSRSDRYRLPDDPWYTGSIAKGGIYAAIVPLSEQGAAAAGGRETVAGHRIAEMGDFFSFIQAEMPQLLAKWQAHRAAS